MNMIPAPSRVLRQVSTWILILMGVGDLAHLLLATLGDLHVLDATQLAVGNATLAFFAGAAKLVQQNIAMTEEQKEAVIASVQAAPTKGPRSQTGGDTVPLYRREDAP